MGKGFNGNGQEKSTQNYYALVFAIFDKSLGYRTKERGRLWDKGYIIGLVTSEGKPF